MFDDVCSMKSLYIDTQIPIIQEVLVNELIHSGTAVCNYNDDIARFTQLSKIFLQIIWFQNGSH